MRPVYVATRGRPDSRLLRILRAEDIDHYAVVEPHERAAYMAAGAARRTLRVLPADDQGFGYARAQTLALAREDDAEWFWMLDDDITGFYACPDVKARKVTATMALSGAEELLETLPWGQAALEYQQYAWRAAKPYARRSYCDVCVAIRTDTPATFRPEAGVKLDRDFTMQVLAAGQDTVRVTAFAFAAPTMGSNAGGLQAEYLAGREQADAAALAALWPEHAEVVTKPNGRVDARINWKAIGGS
jgi:hypothetical protein